MISREQIAAALATVEGLTATTALPDLVTAGAAWPAWAGARPQETIACLVFHPRWQAYVALPGGTRADAADSADELLESVGQALFDAHLPVELVEPVSVQIAPGATDTVPALRFTITD